MKKLGEILIDEGHITEKDLDHCLKSQKIDSTHKIGKLLVLYNYVTEGIVAQAVAQQFKWEFYKGSYKPDITSINKINKAKSLSKNFITEKLVFPCLKGEQTVFVLADATNTDVTDSIRSVFGDNVKFALGIESEIRSAITTYLREKNRAEAKHIDKRFTTITDNELLGWFNNLLNKAIIQGATDIHIEPFKNAIEIRFRIDGILHAAETLNKDHLGHIANIIFQKAESSDTDPNKLHDCKFIHTYLEQEIDVRAAYFKSKSGPSMVLRLLDKNKSIIELQELGFSEHNWKKINAALSNPHGIILLTGPTGCGKTTSLYSMLNYLKGVDTKIITIEDPIEMDIPLLTQVQVNEKRNLGFSEAIRSFLRHDPDIILVGEIRDNETAKEAFRASITGHKVFSTLHTNTPIGSILRLKDIGIDNSYIANALTCVISQRLVRLLCPNCKQPVKAEKAKINNLQAKYLTNDVQQVFDPVGCDKCIEGFWERTVVSEVLIIEDHIRDFIYTDKINLIHKFVENNKQYKTIYDDMRTLVQKGNTSVQEAVRVLG